MTDPTPSAAAGRKTTRLFRHLAYEVLPQAVGRKPDEFAANFLQNPERFVRNLYREAVRGVGRPDDPTVGEQIRVHYGDFSQGHDFYMIEFPAAGQDESPVYCSAVVVDRDSRESVCYVLSAAVGGGTSIRAICDGVNWQLGRGPELGARAFLEHLREVHPTFVGG